MASRASATILYRVLAIIRFRNSVAIWFINVTNIFNKILEPFDEKPQTQFNIEFRPSFSLKIEYHSV